MSLLEPSLRQGLALGATIAVGVAILWFTLTPQALPENGALPLDKLAHLVAFALLILPTAWGYPHALAITLPLALVLGGAIELLQPLVGRGREMADFLMNILGLGLGMVLGMVLRRRRT